MKLIDSASPLASAVPRIALLCATLCVAACGGSGGSSGSPSPLPSPLPTPNGSTVCGSAFLGNGKVSFINTGCTDCSSRRGNEAIDNNRDTAAGMSYQGAGGALTLSATTQPGTVVPAGRKAGALITIPANNDARNGLTITTFLSGQQQESFTGFGSTASPTTTETTNFYRPANTKPYDQIHLVIERRGVVTGPEVKVVEICSE